MSKKKRQSEILTKGYTTVGIIISLVSTVVYLSISETLANTTQEWFNLPLLISAVTALIGVYIIVDGVETLKKIKGVCD